MLEIEQLMENAIKAQQRTDVDPETAWIQYKRDWGNIELSKEAKANLDNIWTLAHYVTSNYNLTKK